MSAPATTRADVARLLGRAAFGATAADMQAWVGKPYVDMVDHLLDVPAAGMRLPQGDDVRRLVLQLGSQAAAEDFRVEQAAAWWLERMRTTAHPLEERLTFLWHGHFATAVSPEQPDLSKLLVQNETLRTHALGSFVDLVSAVTLDPAMLFWLNGTDSAPPKPNENYGREFFELFTLGRRPQVYSERDVREAARAFTGWSANPSTQQVSFNAARHDAKPKRVLGRVVPNLGDQEYRAVVDIALAQPIASRFLANKLVRGLAYVTDDTDLLHAPDPLVARVATALTSSGWQLRPALRVLFLSDEFRFGRRSLVRSPVEVTVAACKALGLAADDQVWVNLQTRMGQRLFRPPNVGGWPHGRDWLSPAAVIARYDLGLQVVTSFRNAPATRIGPALPAAEDLPGWVDVLAMAGLSRNTERSVRGYLASKSAGTPEERQAGVAALLLASPEWTVV